MDPNPANFPILSYVMSKLPQLRLKPEPDSSTIDIEQPPPRSDQIVRRMPHLSDPKLLASMARTVSEVSQTRSVLQALGDRPEHESIDKAKAKIVEIEARLSKQLEEIVLSRRPPDIDRLQWRAHLAEKEEECRVATEKEKEMYKAIVQLDEMHEAYEKMLKEAEQRLEKIYQVAEGGGDSSVEGEEVIEEVNEEVVGLLQEASGRGIDKVDLSGRRLKVLPEALVRIQGLIILNFSSNQLEAIPDSIAGLSNLEELNLSSNLLESLPDSIGLLQNLKFLNVSGNKLEALPDSICSCRSLVELDASFNNLTYLPTNIGYELVNLKRLSIQLNKIRSLPTSIGEMKSLCNLDAHFNELRGLPLSIGQLSNLEVLNLSNNFTDLKELPDSFGDVTNLKELDLSNNQIHALPDTFGRLDNLVNLNLVENPIEIPPVEVVEKGVEAVKVYMAKRYILLEEEQKSMATTEEPEKIGAGWLTRSTSWLSSVAENISGYLSPRKSGDPCLDQQL